VQQQSRYIIETNIERFEGHLRSGLLDAEQTRTVIALLAEARQALNEFQRRCDIVHQPATAQTMPPASAHSS